MEQQEYFMRMQMLGQEAEQIEKQIQIIDQQISEMSAVRESIDEIRKIEKPIKKEILGFELIVLTFWLFQKINIFSKTIHKLVLDEIHKQYYTKLKKKWL